MKAKIIEIFSSIQGEGLWIGHSQVFVRFHGCKLKCNYCDTPLTHHQIQRARIENIPFTKKFQDHDLEFSMDQLNEEISKFNLPSIAITGGEPLEQVNFLSQWLPRMSADYQILLETSGVMFNEVLKIKNHLQMISFDLKLSSSSKERPYWQEHYQFIKNIQDRPHYAKVVFDENITEEEIDHLYQLLEQFPQLIIIFQPVMPLRKINLPKVLEIYFRISIRFPLRVKLIPQVHKFLSVM